MKTYLKKSMYKSIYQSLILDADLIKIPADWNNVMTEDELTNLIFNSKWLTLRYTKQSLKSFAETIYGWYYNTMFYLICLKDRCDKHSDI